MTTGSLRRALLGRLSFSFALSLALLIPLIYQLIQWPARQVYDHDISDSALSLTHYLRIVDGVAQFNLPAAAEQLFRTDSLDEVHYLVREKNRSILAGDVDLAPSIPMMLSRSNLKPVMYSGLYRGRDVRIGVTQRRIDGREFVFASAETTNKLNILAGNSVFATLVSLFVLILVSLINVWYGIRYALVPLDDIRAALHDMRQASPVPLSLDRVPSEIRPLVQEFNSLLQRLDASAAAQQRFVANAAHQLRTPLAGIRTQLELLRDQISNAAQRERITMSIDAIVRLAHLVHQMLALLSSVPGAREVSRHTVVNPSVVIQERMTEWVHLAHQQGVDLGFELEEATIRGDPVLIGEMIANLVDNAMRYSTTNPTVTVRCYVADACLILEVEDNGPGIAEHERALVFERFYRSPSSAAIPGSGLGLSIVGEVAGGIGGSVHIGRGPNDQGCIVRICCPLHRVDA